MHVIKKDDRSILKFIFRFISDKDEDDPIPELPESLKPEIENTLSYDE